MFALHLYANNHDLFMKTWPTLLAMAIVLLLCVGIFKIWLSRMRLLFSATQEGERVELLKKAAGDFLRLYALLIICIIVGLSIAEALPV
jgi:pyrroloquinoline quinone (PQQ) biosynthesis protein C